MPPSLKADKRLTPFSAARTCLHGHTLTCIFACLLPYDSALLALSLSRLLSDLVFRISIPPICDFSFEVALCRLAPA